MTLVLPGIVGLLGAAIGSFLNVVIHRVPHGISVVTPSSACPSCAAPIRALDNIPVLSWLLLRGRCRACAAPISPRYVLVELLTALVFAALAALQLPDILVAADPVTLTAVVLELVALLWFAGASIVLTVIDLENHRLPDAIVLPAYPVIVGLLGTAALLTGAGEDAARAAAGAGILFGSYMLLALISPRGMGMGDVKLAGVIGLVLGWYGWAALVVGAMAAFFLGGLVGLALIATRRARRSSGIPFGPWMLGGAWVGILLGEPIARGYLALVGLN